MGKKFHSLSKKANVGKRTSVGRKLSRFNALVAEKLLEEGFSG
jgi:hypothetical protein